MHDPEQITYFAQTDARNRRLTFGIKAKDRTKHVYLIGKTGMGKSTVLENMAAQDIKNGNGFCFIDPHGSAIETILQYIPKSRMKDVIYFAPFDMEHPISFNVMEDVGYDKRHLVVSGLMSTFKKIWQDVWSARMEYILGNTLLALLEYPNATLLEVNKMLADKEFRNKVVANITDHTVKSFWVDEFAKYTDRFAAEATPAIQNKIGQFTSNPLIRNIVGQPKSSFDLREVMDERKILLVNLSKGRVGEVSANLLGSMIITKLYLASLSRADVSKEEMKNLPNFYMYVDEFQSFANDSFADILSEARKYKLNLTIAHQYIEQMSDQVRAAVFGNIGTMITFRVGSYDAEVLEKEFAPVFTAEDIVNLGFAQIYLRLMIDGIGSQPFSAVTLPPLERPGEIFVDDIVAESRKRYARPRSEVEEIIKKLHSDPGKEKDHSGKNDGQGDRNDRGGRNDRGSGDNRGPRNESGSRNGEYHDERKSNFDRRQEKPRPAFSQKNREKISQVIEQSSNKIENENLSGVSRGVSLKDMSMKMQRPKNDKGPSAENKNSLKDALLGVLGDLKNDIKKESNNSKEEIKFNVDKKPDIEKNANIDSAEKNTNQTDQKSEIPEKELKKILGID